MFNVGGGEVLVILLVALLVLGPGKLPEAARQIGRVLTQLRQMSSGFQNEIKSAMDETIATPEPAADGADTSDSTNDSDDPDVKGDGTDVQGDEAPMAAGDDPTRS